MNTTGDSPSVTWYFVSRKLRWLCLLIFVIPLLLSLHPGRATTAGIVSIWIICGAAFYGIWRMVSHPSIKATPSGLLVTNPYSQISVPWDDVSGFEPTYWGFRIMRRSGGSTLTTALVKSNVDRVRHTRTRADAVTDYLVELAHQDAPARLATLQLGMPTLDYVGFTKSGKHPAAS